jgi:hypothetical protein
LVRLKSRILGTSAVSLALSLLAACATPTAVPGAFETALAGTVHPGSTAIAQTFAGQRATLTAAAPTATHTLAPSSTPTETAPPTETVTPAATPTPSATPTEAATATQTVPPPTLPPPPTATASAALAGTYPQSGACISMNAHGVINRFGQPASVLAGLYVVCVPLVVVRPSLEVQVNVTWLFTRDGMPPDLLNVVQTDVAVLPAYNGSVVYLQDNLGRQANQTGLEGAARDGASGQPGSVFSGYYLFPPVQAGATNFTLVDTHRKLTVGNITLSVRAP